MQNGATWSSFSGFAQGLTDEQVETLFNQAVGGAYFEPGVHKVTIVGTSPFTSQAKGTQMIKLELEGDKGETIRSFVPLVGKDKNGNPGLHFRLRGLISAIIPNPELRIKYTRAASADGTLLGALNGMKLRVEISAPKKGFRVDSVGDAYKVVNIQTGEGYEDLAEFYDSFTEAADAAKAKEYRKGYNEVSNFLKGSEEDGKANEEAINEALRSSQENVSSIAAKKSAASRPASI